MAPVTVRNAGASQCAAIPARSLGRFSTLQQASQYVYTLTTLVSFHKDVGAIKDVEPVPLSAASELLAALFRPKSKAPAEPLQLD